MAKSGWKLSDSAKAKMREAWKKRKLKPFSDTTKLKMSIARRKEKNPNWQGGKLKMRLQEAKQRDNYTCCKCALYVPDIAVVDHIVPRFFRPDLAYMTSNLQTLCPNCHARKTIDDRKQIASFKRKRGVLVKTRYQNSVCRRGVLHNFQQIRLTHSGSLERCTKCGLQMHFPTHMPNHLYLSYHIRSVLRANDPMFKKEYPHAI